MLSWWVLGVFNGAHRVLVLVWVWVQLLCQGLCSSQLLADQLYQLSLQLCELHPHVSDCVVQLVVLGLFILILLILLPGGE